MKKNILLFGHGFATQFIDISNQYTLLFDKNKFHVTVVYLTGEENEMVRKKHCADEVIFLNSPKKSTRGLKTFAIKKMLNLHRAKNFQIVVCHRYKPTYVMLIVAKFLKIPNLFSVMHELGTMRSIPRKIIIKLLDCHTVFAGVSNAVRDDLRKTLWGVPSERIITLYNMMDTEQTEKQFLSKEVARATLNLQPSDFVFGTIGRLAINKDQKTLLKAFSLIKNHCPQSKLIIIGDGNLEQQLRNQAAELNILHDVIFTGFLKDGYQYAKALDVYISSSIQEAFGRVLIEAMLAKIPIIATRVNGVPEVVGDAGILIEAANAEYLAEHMLSLYQSSHEQRMAMAEKAYARVKNEFSLQKFNEIFWGLNFTNPIGIL